MENAVKTISESELVRDEVTKAVLGALAGFAASKLTAKLYDTLVIARRLKNVS